MSRTFNYLLLLIVTVLASSSIANAAPSQQARYVSFSKVDSDQMRISWINGNGGNRMVIMGLASNWSSSITSAITDGTNYTANNSYGAGDDIGSFEVVYNGSGRTRYVDVSNLTSSTSYTVAVIEYNYQGGQTSYNVGSSTNNPRSKQTTVAAPNTITFGAIGSTQADAMWDVAADTQDGFIVQLFDLTSGEIHFDYDEADIGNPNSGTSKTLTLDYLEGGYDYSFRVKSYTGNEESGWAGELYGASATSFTTNTDNTDPSFDITYYSDANLTTQISSSTVGVGTYYIEIVSSEPLDSNPTVFIDNNTGTDGGPGTFTDSDYDVNGGNTLAYSSTTFVYTRTISSTTYSDGLTGENAQTITISGTDYSGNSVNTSATSSTPAVVYEDNTPPNIFDVTFESGTFGISNTVSLTISTDNPNYTSASIWFNDNTATNFLHVGSNTYTASYTVVEGDNNIANPAAINLSASITDLAGNSSTYFTTSYVDGSGGFEVDAASPTITTMYLPAGNHMIGDVISATFETTNANPGSLFYFASSSFNSTSVTNFSQVGSSNSYSVDYTVVNGETDVNDYLTELQFTFTLQDYAGNNSDEFWETSINSVTITGGNTFTIDANPPSITDVTYPSGTFGIGSDVSVTITATENNLSFNSASINGSNSISYDGATSTEYFIDYTIQEGDSDRLSGNASSIPGTFTLTDASGNVSNTFTSAADDTGVYIDATRPSVTYTAINAGSFGIDDDLIFEISTDGRNYTAASATIQDNEVSATYSNNSSLTYNLTYTVQSGDGEHYADLSSVSASVSVTDNAGNSSTVYFDPVTQDGGFVYIDGEAATVN